MNKYNYLAEIANDIINWMDKDGDSFDISQFDNRADAADYLYDELWTEDAVTGNGGEYYNDESECEEYLCHNLNLLFDALFEFGELEESLLDDLHKHFNKKDFAQWADCTIRCYLLGDAIDKALAEWEDYGFKYKKEKLEK